VKIRYTPIVETFSESKEIESKNESVNENIENQNNNIDSELESVNTNTDTTSKNNEINTSIKKSIVDTPVETNTETKDENDYIEKEFVYTTSSALNVNDEISLEYEPNNPENIRKPMRNPNIIGYILVGVGFCVCIGTIITTTILSKSKTARQVYGVSGAFSNLYKIVN
jgi:hypothetical protein